MDVNPYQPSSELPDAEFVKSLTRPPAPLGTWGVYWRTVLAITLSGAGFGLIMACIAFVSMTFVDDEFWVNTETFLMVPMAVVVGGALAMAFAMPIVGIAVGISTVFMSNRPWIRSRILRFALLNGFLTGMLAISIPARLDPMVLAFSLIPGLFGGVVSLLLVCLLARHVPANRQVSTPLSIPVDAN